MVVVWVLGIAGHKAIASGSHKPCVAISNRLSEEDNDGYIAEIKIIKWALTEAASPLMNRNQRVKTTF